MPYRRNSSARLIVLALGAGVAQSCASSEAPMKRELTAESLLAAEGRHVTLKGHVERCKDGIWMRGVRVRVLLPEECDGPYDQAEWEAEVTGRIVFMEPAHEEVGNDWTQSSAGWKPDTYKLVK